MMMSLRKKRLVIAVAGTVGLAASIAQAEEFGASATVQNTLAVTVVQDFDLGTIFASATGQSFVDDGVGAITISAEDGSTATVGNPAISLISLGTPVPAQGSVDMSGDFFLNLPDTSTILVADLAGEAKLANLADGTTFPGVAELVHESANPSVPSLFLMHFTVADVSGGEIAAVTGATDFDGNFKVTQEFAATSYVFNIGATLTTEPGAAATGAGAETDEIPYQEGLYSGTFEVTASY